MKKSYITSGPELSIEYLYQQDQGYMEIWVQSVKALLS